MRHRKRGRRLGRSSTHRRAMLRNLVTSLFLTERDDDFYEGLTQADGRGVVNKPARKGRVVTTLQKAKEARALTERCITIAKRSMKAQAAADEFATDAERNTDEWKSWRKSEQHRKWVDAVAPVVNARRRVFAILRDKEAVSLLFDEIAPRYADRPGGYTRVMRLATPRLGDAGTRAILELVGENDRMVSKSEAPAFGDDDAEDSAAPVASDDADEAAVDSNEDQDSSEDAEKNA